MALSCLQFLVHYLRVWKPNFSPNFLFLHFECCSCFLKITKDCNKYPVTCTCYNCNEYSQPWAYGHTTLEQHEFMSVECCGVEAYANRFVTADKILRLLSVVPCDNIG